MLRVYTLAPLAHCGGVSFLMHSLMEYCEQAHHEFATHFVNQNFIYQIRE